MRTCIRFFLAFLLASCTGLATTRGAHPQGRLPVKRSVTIYRDDWGVPHIYADREEDGFYGLGYAQAQDRLTGLLRKFLEVQGRSASVFGPAAADTDLRNLQWMHLEQAKTAFNRFEPQLRRDYSNFIRGVERYMRDHLDEVPSWAPRLDPTLPIAVLDSDLWGVNDVQGIEDCARGGVTISEADRVSEKSRGLSAASNEWVVMPSRTADHVLIHMEDSHALWVRAVDERPPRRHLQEPVSNQIAITRRSILHRAHRAVWRLRSQGFRRCTRLSVLADRRWPESGCRRDRSRG